MISMKPIERLSKATFLAFISCFASHQVLASNPVNRQPDAATAAHMIRQMNCFTGDKYMGGYVMFTGLTVSPYNRSLEQGLNVTLQHELSQLENVFPYCLARLLTASELTSNQKWQLIIDSSLLKYCSSEQAKKRKQIAKGYSTLIGEWGHKNTTRIRRLLDFDPLVSVEPFKYQPFHRNTLLKIYSRQVDFEYGHRFPFGSHGDFAYDGSRLVYLCGNNRLESVTQILRTEATALNEIDLALLTRFFNDALLNKSGCTHWIISHPQEILEKEKEHYAVDMNELKNCEKILLAPSISGDQETGWKLRFITASGFWPYLNTVKENVFTIAPDFKVTQEETVLTKKIFSRCPDYRF
jgi:hypothetical protein